jgi:precorrin-6A/cobalt-precorrin-6A reductase
VIANADTEDNFVQGDVTYATAVRSGEVAVPTEAKNDVAAPVAGTSHIKLTWDAAADATGVPMLALRRPGWEPVDGDRWLDAGSVTDAVRMLGDAPRRVFLALGRQEVAVFEAAPQHCYLIRSVDPVEPRLAVPDADYLLARGPFREPDERALLKEKRIDVVVSKNSGGEATYGKIAAARALGIDVVMVRRPLPPQAPSAETVDALAAMVDHFFEPDAERGV